jgi:hypothetical protein
MFATCATHGIPLDLIILIMKTEEKRRRDETGREGKGREEKRREEKRREEKKREEKRRKRGRVIRDTTYERENNIEASQTPPAHASGREEGKEL